MKVFPFTGGPKSGTAGHTEFTSKCNPSGNHNVINQTARAFLMNIGLINTHGAGTRLTSGGILWKFPNKK